ncbi:MAG: RDD family protein [Acidimicrobiales bacterium]|nr:RDD family protein [Acidimicrobiales bacterium]
MRYEDAISTQTPEGVTIDMTLAGLGSRFAAAIVDGLLHVTVVLAIGTLIALSQNNAVAAVGTIAIFVWLFGYDVAFELRASGRTIGKRVTGLRVVKVDGRPVDFRASVVRNLLRLVDLMPLMYLVGVVTIFVSKRNQRLGDLAAGTVVMREVKGQAKSVQFRADDYYDDDLETWDVSRVSASDVAAVRQFLERRVGLEASARDRLARDLARRLFPMVVGPPAKIAPEKFLERLLAAKSARSR